HDLPLLPLSREDRPGEQEIEEPQADRQPPVAVPDLFAETGDLAPPAGIEGGDLQPVPGEAARRSPPFREVAHRAPLAVDHHPRRLLEAGREERRVDVGEMMRDPRDLARTDPLPQLAP